MPRNTDENRLSGQAQGQDVEHLWREARQPPQEWNHDRQGRQASERNEGYLEDVWRESRQIPERQRNDFAPQTGSRSSSLNRGDINRNQAVYDYRGNTEQAEYRGQASHHGKGPKGYRRSDQRILEEICELLTEDSQVDASDIEIQCKEGKVVLEGEVATRQMRYRAEDLADQVRGVEDIENRIRVMKS